MSRTIVSTKDVAENVVECSLCAALVYRESFATHQKWHGNQPGRPRCRQHTLYQSTCATCVASRS